MKWIVFVLILTIICLFISILEYVDLWNGLGYFTELLLLLGVPISVKVPGLLYSRLVSMKVKVV